MVRYNGFEIEIIYYPEEQPTNDKHGSTPYVAANWEIVDVADIELGIVLNDEIAEFLYANHKEEITKLIEGDREI